MLTAKSMFWIKRLALTALALAVFLSSTPAFAVGRVQWTKKTIKERTDTKSWKIEVAIFLPKPPDIPHMSMKFEFQPVAYFERARVDDTANPSNKKGVLTERRVPLQHRQSLIESVDVGFIDPRDGKTQKRTKFSFKVTRGHGFEAGEYKVKIRDASGRTIGGQTKITFEGENKVIDRRTISFIPGEDGKKKKSKMKKVKDGEVEDGDEEGEEGEEGSKEGDEEEAGDLEFVGAEETGEALDEVADEPTTIKEKPGGCGCRLDNNGTGNAAGAAALALVALAGLRRRRAA